MLPLLLLACQSASDDTGEPLPADHWCHDDLAVGETEVVASGFTAGTEGITFVDGRLFVAEPTGVVEIVDGTASRVASLDSALGLAPGLTGMLLADPGEFTFDGSGDDGRLLHIGLDGAAEVLAEGMPNPNFVTTLRGGPVLVSDDTAAIYAVEGGDWTLWSDEVPSPNGMVHADPGPVYVVSTFEPDPPLWRVDAANFAAGAPEVVTTFDTGSAPDGLALDGEGQVWVALNLAGEIVRIDPETGAQTARHPGLDTPASLAFGEGDFDPCSLYVTELYGEDVLRLSTGVPGRAPAPFADD